MLLNRASGFCRRAKRFVVIVAAILFFAVPVYGQIHLSRERCLANIGGTPVQDKKGADIGQPLFEHVLTFHKGDYNIFIGFKNEKSVLFEITRLDLKPLSEAEIYKYLDFNSEDLRFVKQANQKPVDAGMGYTFWERADGKATAVSKEQTDKQMGRLEVWDHDFFPDRARY